MSNPSSGGAHDKGGDTAKSHEAHLIPGLNSRVFGFPNSIITKLRYAEVLPVTSTTGAVTHRVFAANGIFDPYLTGVGHQPMYRDTYAGIYDQYTVIGSKFTCTFVPRTVTNGFLVGVCGDDDSSFTTTLTTIMEQNNSQSAAIGNLAAGSVTLTQTFEPLRDFGVATKDDGYSATSVGSNPNELWCISAWVATIDGATTDICDIYVDIEYTVKFSELQTPTSN